MSLKLMSHLFLILICLSIVACQGAEITCKPSSEITSPAGSGILKATWKSNSEKDVVSYRIFYGTSPGKYKNCIDVGKGTESSSGVIEYTLTGLVNGTRYYVAVVAIM